MSGRLVRWFRFVRLDGWLAEDTQITYDLVVDDAQCGIFKWAMKGMLFNYKVVTRSIGFFVVFVSKGVNFLLLFECDYFVAGWKVIISSIFDRYQEIPRATEDLVLRWSTKG